MGDGIVPRHENPQSWVIDCQRPPSDVTKKSIHYGSKQLETRTMERTSNASNVGRAKQMKNVERKSEQCEQMGERKSRWPSTYVSFTGLSKPMCNPLNF